MILLNKNPIKKFIIENKSVDKIFLNDSVIFEDDEKNRFVRGWDTKIVLTITSRASSVAASGFSDLVFFSGTQSMQLKYCDNGRNSGSAIITRNGKAETEQPRARGVSAIPSGYQLEEFDARLDISTSNIYVNNGYYYITYVLGAARRISMNLSTDSYCSALWTSITPVTINLYDFVPNKIVFGEWYFHGAASPFTYNLKVTATNIEEPSKQVVLCDKTGVNIAGKYAWATESFDLSLLNGAIA